MKHLIDLDEAALAAARDRLGTATLKDTVNAALRVVAGQDDVGQSIEASLNALAEIDFVDREQAWR